MKEIVETLLSEYESKAIPLTKEQNIAHFNASISGRNEDYAKSTELAIKVTKLHADKHVFSRLAEVRKADAVSEPLLKRQLEVLYRLYLSNQLDEAKLRAIVELQNEIEKRYATHRAEIDGKPVTDNEIEEILRTTARSDVAQKAWLASKAIGPVVAPDVLALVRMRNDAARELGFENHHTMVLELSDQDPEALRGQFDELDELTRDSFRTNKG